MRLRQLPVLLGCIAVTAYFAYHAMYGRHGFEVHNRLVERSQLLDFEIRSLEAVRTKLERDVALLSSDKPDPDFVDELARDILGFARPEDQIYLRDFNRP